MRRAAAIACAGLAVTGAFALGLLVEHEPARVPSAAPHPAWHPVVRGLTPFTGFVTSWSPPLLLREVREALETSYYRLVPGEILARPTVDLMLDGLHDPYTAYLDPAEYLGLQQSIASGYFGVGLTVGPGEHGLIVTSSLEGPARDAGIRPGDIIVSIDGEPATKIPFDRSLALIKGEPGTIVHLTVRRPGERRPMRFTVVRQEIEAPAVRHRLLRTHGHRLGYVRILSFREDVTSAVAAATTGLVRRGAEGIVLDLRGDPGGLLSQAVDVTSLFLESGVVCSTVGVHETHLFTVAAGAIETRRPLVVLVDRLTASAAEIVAGALVDNGRAILVGQRTYGKATVQSLVPLSNGGALKLTTATYVTPAGRNIGGTGIRPKVKAVDDPVTRPDEAVVAAEQVLLEHDL